jgi:hypothetical protein
MDTFTFIATVIGPHGVISSAEFEARDKHAAFRVAHTDEVLLRRLQVCASEAFDSAAVVDPLSGYGIEVKPKPEPQLDMGLEQGLSGGITWAPFWVARLSPVVFCESSSWVTARCRRRR